MEKPGTRPAPHRIGGYDVRELSTSEDKCTDFRGAMRDSAEKKDTQPNIPQIDIDKEFCIEMADLMFLQINADEIGFTEKEKKKLGDEIFRRMKIVISQGRDETIEFLNKAYETNYELLQSCLPDALQENEWEYHRLKELSVEDKIRYLDDEANWWPQGCTQDREFHKRKLSTNQLFTALVLLDDIISREQGR